MLGAWRQRPLGEVRVLYLDARHTTPAVVARCEKVRVDGQIRDVAILIASGVLPGGKRQIPGVSVSLSEAEVHWRTFLQELVAREMRGVQLVVSDDHAGLDAARRAVLGGVPWQRCQFHLQQNALQYVPRKSMRNEVAEDIRTIFPGQDIRRCPRSGDCGSLSGAHGGQIRAHRFQAFRLAGGEYPGRLYHIRFSGASLATPANHEQSGVEVVDTTAASDAFAGAFTLGLQQGRALEEALRRACAAGALAVSRFGAQPSLPTLEELEQFLQRIA